MMSLSKDTRDIISYLDGTMPLYRRPAFEERLTTESELREKADKIRKLRVSISKIPSPADKTTGSTISIRPAYRNLFYAVAAALVLLLIAYRAGLFSSKGVALPDNTAQTEVPAKSQPELPPIETQKENMTAQEVLPPPSKQDNNNTPVPIEKKLPINQENIAQQQVVPEEKSPEKPTPSTVKSFIFKQRTGTGGFAALPEQNNKLPHSVQDSIPWKMEVYVSQIDGRPSGSLNSYQIDRNKRMLVLYVSEKDKVLIENSKNVSLERVSDLKLTLFSGSKPLLLLLNGTIELAD